MVERISGRTLDVFLDERIFRPLEMNWTAYGVRELNCLSASYTWTEGRLQRIHRAEAWGHTGLVSTVLDLARWDMALHGDRLLGRESLQLMWTPARLRNGTEVGYGLGWDIGETEGHRTVGHGGSRPGVSTRLLHDLRNELSVILLIPVGGVDTIALASGVLHAVTSG
jgi:CubicO group peptidase (beta-lactamase class C family)